MANRKLDKTWLCVCISSSISNFKEKILENWKIKEWHFRNLFEPVLFIGLYHIFDYLKFLLHRGEKAILWCGSDIKNLNKLTILLIRKNEHYCENWTEWFLLKNKGISALIKPIFFDNINDFPISFKPLEIPQVFLCCHPNREEEYGINIIEKIAYGFPKIIFHIYGIKKKNTKNIIYHGLIPNKQFNQEIKNYQAGIRLNKFEGFSEVLAKSILLGQYPISRIYYPYIDYAGEINSLIHHLNKLKYKKEPNHKAREYWYKKLCEPLLLEKDK